ncbi:DNA alkylation repair protein [soil metagenome]
MKLSEVMDELKALGNEKLREMNSRHGITGDQFGIKMGDLRVIAKKIKVDMPLARELWKTGNFEAMMLSTLIVRPKDFTTEELETMVKSVTTSQLADWLMSYVVKGHPEKESLRTKWMASSDSVMASRAGWSLTAERINKDPEGIDLKATLDRIEREMLTVPEPVQWTMNYCLAGIGSNFPEYRKRATDIGEKLGVFRDYPTPKGCTSPFAPLWIDAMVKRQA